MPVSGGQPGSNPLLIRSTTIGNVGTTETPTTIPAMIVPSVSTCTPRPLIAVVPGNQASAGVVSQGQPKLIRANLTPGHKTSVQTVKGSVMLPAGVSVQPNTTVGQSRLLNAPNASEQAVPRTGGIFTLLILQFIGFIFRALLISLQEVEYEFKLIGPRKYSFVTVTLRLPHN